LPFTATLLGIRPADTKALQGRQPRRGNPKQNRFSVNLLREKGGPVVKPGYPPRIVWPIFPRHAANELINSP
jgi:hypothetical protein